MTTQIRPAPQQPAEKRLFTVADYYRMAEVGILRPDERVELIEGEIIQMSPIGSLHGGTVNRLNALLGRLVGPQAIVSVQNPVHLDDYSEPEPDVALLKPRADYYTTSHPTPSDILLLLEVSDTTVLRDKREKLPLYARSAIPSVWIVDLAQRAIHVHADPADGHYQVSTLQRLGQALDIPGVPGATITVDAILA